MRNKRFRVVRKHYIVNDSHKFDGQKGISSEQCVVGYKNVNCLAKQSGLCIAAAQYCTGKR